MQLLIPALSILLLTIILGSGSMKDLAGKDSMVMRMQKAKIKKATPDFQTERPSVYYSRFDMIVN